MIGRKLLVLATLWSTLAMAATPTSVKDLSDHPFSEIIAELAQSGEESKEILALFGELNGNGPGVEVAAKKLAENADENIIFALLVRIESEFKAKAPNVKLAELLFRFVGATASDKYLDVLRSLREQLDDKALVFVKDRRFVRRALELAMTQARTRTEIVKYHEVAVKAADSAAVTQAHQKLFREYLDKAASERQSKGGRFAKNDLPDTAEGFLLKGSSHIITDQIRVERARGTEIKFTGRDEVIERAMNIMTRSQGKMPVLVGLSGSGKSTTAYMIAQVIFDSQYPDSPVFHEQFANAEVIETSPARISQMALSNEPTAQSAALELYFDAVRKTEENYKERFGHYKPIIILIDNVQNFDPPQLAALKHELENTAYPIRVIGTAFSEALDRKLQSTAGMNKVIEKVPVREFTADEARAVIEQTWAPLFAQKYGVTITSDAYDALFRVSRFLKPDLALPEAPIRIFEDLAVSFHANAPEKKTVINEQMIYEYAQKQTGLPTNPRDASEFSSYLAHVRERLEGRVINQPFLTAKAMSALERTLTDDPRRPVALLFGGPTGTGKTLVGQSLAEYAYQDRSRLFTVDGGSLKDGKRSLNGIFGDPNCIGSVGTLMEWLDDPARGKFGGVLLINEADKMHLDVWVRLMEFMDQGVIYGCDGKPRYANRHTIILTSNKSAKIVFPDSVVDWSDDEIQTRAIKIDENEIKNMLLQKDPTTSNKDEIVLPAEIVGRIDMAALALPVTKSKAPKIAALEITEFLKTFKAEYGVNVEVSQSLNNHLAVTGVDLHYGARNIRSQVKTYLTPALTEARAKWGLKKGETLKMSLDAGQHGEGAQIIITYKGESIKTAAPKIQHDNPLEDESTRKMLEGLSEKMHAHMPEQPEAVDIIVEAIRGKFGDYNRRRPISIVIVGRTGLGKTELGKAAAFAMYGEVERYSGFSMSDIVNEKTWDTLFIPQFERALTQNPQGGVIIPDEFSNVGGGKNDVKAALLLKFLHILEEGVWTSPNTGKQYNLKDYLFVFTGNDLQELTQGLTSDEENLEVWQQLHAQNKVEELLKLRGVPESFIGRQAAVVMIKPLVGDGKGRVAERLIVESRKRWLSQHKGIDIVWDNTFSNQMGHSFFTHSRGARSVRKVLDQQISALITSSLLKYGYDQKNMAGVTVKLSMHDDAEKKPFVEGNKIPERHVVITAELSKGGQVVQSMSVNATDSAEPIEVVLEKEADLVSFHELGHAFLNDETLTGLRFEYLSIRGRIVDGERVVGLTRYSSVVGSSAGTSGQVTRRNLLARLKQLLGGRLAQERAGFDPDAGWADDLEKMRKMATEYFLKFGLKDGLVAMNVDNQGRPQPDREQLSEMQKEMQALFLEARTAAENELKEKWPLLLKAQAELKAQGQISGDALRSQYLQSGAQLDSSNGSSSCAKLFK